MKLLPDMIIVKPETSTMQPGEANLLYGLGFAIPISIILWIVIFLMLRSFIWY